MSQSSRDQSNPHYIQGVTRRIISLMLQTTVREGMFDQIMQAEGMAPEVIEGVKNEVTRIAETFLMQSEYHKALWEQQTA